MARKNTDNKDQSVARADDYSGIKPVSIVTEMQ